MVANASPSMVQHSLITPRRDRIILHCDASGVKGIGGWWNTHAFSTRLPHHHRPKLIDWKEAYAVLFAFAKWGQLWAGKAVHIMSDNAVVVNAINSRTVHGQAIDPLQLLFLTAALYDIEISSDWLSSADNWIADALSRFELQKIANIFPQFQGISNPYRETGKPMSVLREKLRTFFGMDSLPTLVKSTVSVKKYSKSSLMLTDSSPHSRSNLKRSPSLLQRQRKKRRLSQPNHMSSIFGAITLTGAIPLQYSMTTASNVSSGAQLVNMG